MRPTLKEGQIVIARRARKLQAGDVIVFRHGGIEKIKRIIEISDEQIYVRGDNADASTDSREFGAIDNRSVTLKVIWPRI